MKIEIYSDIACPWCYVGERRLTRALAAFPAGAEVEVVFRPYQLDPTAPDEAQPMPAYLERRFGRPMDGKFGHVSSAAAEEGITMHWDRAYAANTRTAHRLSRLALHEYGPGVQRALMDRLFDAQFTNGGNLADHGQLARLASAAGMDEERVRGYLASEEGKAELEAEFADAREQGITAVPTFVFDGLYAVQGAQPTSTLLQVLEEVQRLSTPPVASVAADADDAASCADDSCAVRDARA